ncbi:efflux RND transporter periplasmic adaptor subunit [Taibaiella sp. KBW10]|uniref:efflux RND transporter periplasmic adaptor subunit n=1 Tax=Taibaiella sp. KBW10 TaxID=2153357 RepID=UPI000F5A4144|nr:efflux RND transporter periplasmic adaptor subunit [Taibaiella sp. KBW10]RQO31707.1 efflux RND transporter periplasmic adaptor subunit [Taibaiella sp. KBW10]
MNFKISIPVLLMIVLAAACGTKEQPPVVSDKYVLSDTMMNMIQLDSVRTSTVVDQLVLTGSVSFNENNVVNIFPRSSGQIVSTNVSLGDYVRRGQVLAVIRSAEVAGSYSELNSANADISIAKREMESAEGLYKNGISSEREYVEAKQNYQKTLAQASKIKAEISINGGSGATQSGNYTLTAPIDGYVVAKNATTGAFIRSDDGKNIFTVSNLNNVWVNANVYESDIPKVKQGYSVKIIPMSYPDKTFEGKIEKVGDVLDPENKAMSVRISLANKDMLLKPEMFVKVIVENTQGGMATCIPASSLVSIDSKNYVVVFNSKSDVKIAEVTVLKKSNDLVFIQSADLKVGQKVVTKYQSLIFEELQKY